jgi:uncharacterized Tic20 family protein
MTTATCKNCKAELTAGYDFCLACGMPAPTDVAVPDPDAEASPVLPPPPPNVSPPPADPPPYLPPPSADPPPYLPPPPPAGYEPQPVPAAGSLRADEERNWSVAAHLSALLTLVGIPSAIGPLVVWLMKKDSSPTVDAHGKEAVNFNLSFMLYGVVSFVLIFVLIGFLLLPIVLIAWFALVIVGTLNASRSEFYRYPLTIRFIK